MDEKNVKRIYKEMEKLQQQLGVTMEEYHRIAALNAVIQDQLNTEQDKTFKMEESLKVCCAEKERSCSTCLVYLYPSIVLRKRHV